MKNSVGMVWSWKMWRYVAWADPELAAPMWQLIGLILTNAKWGGGDYSVGSSTAEHYLEHNALVRKVCPPERLLNFKLGSGWETLCEFLGKEIPDVPYPNVNDTEMFVRLHKAILDRATVFAVRKVLTWTAPVGLVVAGAAWYWQRLRS
jgi:Sulfotransferase domain